MGDVYKGTDYQIGVELESLMELGASTLGISKAPREKLVVKKGR